MDGAPQMRDVLDKEIAIMAVTSDFVFIQLAISFGFLLMLLPVQQCERPSLRLDFVFDLSGTLLREQVY